MKRIQRLAALALVLGLTVSQSASAFEKDIVDTAVEAGSFNTLATALTKADLVSALKGPGPFTVFAPTDDAFAKLPPGVLAELLLPQNKKKLADVLTYHVASGSSSAGQAAAAGGATSLNGQRIDVGITDGRLMIDNAFVVKNDIKCSNGIIHVIDAVILPADENIPATALKAGVFETLVAAVGAADLGGALSGPGPLTVFAPTDDAFAKLPAGTVESLLKPENKQKLVDILKYHVVSGRIYSPDALKAGSVATLQGSRVVISAASGSAKVNNANLVKTDIDASNGVIHVVDSVLLPGSAPSIPAAQVVSRQIAGGTPIAGGNPQTMIINAIEHGAPMFNEGRKSACAQLYMNTASAVLRTPNHGLSSTVVNTLQNALNNARQMSSPDSQAWTMRYALDTALTHVSR